MLSTSVRQSAEEFQLKEAIAQRQAVDCESIIVYQEIGIFLTELFKSFHSPRCRVIAAAPVIADMAMAAERADTELVECESNEPFAIDIDSLKSKIKSNGDIIHLANPNRLTGAALANSQLKILAASVNEGLLIIDEYYHDFSGLSALPLLKHQENVIILRSFENWLSAQQPDFGYAMVSEQFLKKRGLVWPACGMGRATARKCFEIFEATDLSKKQVRLILENALRAAKELTRIGVNCQLAPADFVLLQVSNAGEIQEYLGSCGIRVERIGQVGPLQNYLRYQITADDKVRQLVKAFSSMLTLPTKSQEQHKRIKHDFVSKDKVVLKSNLR